MIHLCEAYFYLFLIIFLSNLPLTSSLQLFSIFGKQNLYNLSAFFLKKIYIGCHRYWFNGLTQDIQCLTDNLVKRGYHIETCGN